MIEAGVLPPGNLDQSFIPDCYLGVMRLGHLLSTSQPADTLFPLPGTLFPGFHVSWLIPLG
jgi:hypothetical protein